MALRVLTDNDARILQRLIDRERRRPGNTTGRAGSGSVDHEEHQAPETYIARIPTGGIDAFTEDVGTGTGTGEFDVPGCADCDIYRVVPRDIPGTGTGAECDAELVPIPGLARHVVNVGGSRVRGDQFVVVTRDKFGSWLAQPQPAQQGYFVATSAVHALFSNSYIFNGNIYVYDLNGAGTAVVARLLDSDIYAYSVGNVAVQLNTPYPAIDTGRTITAGPFGEKRFYNIKAEPPFPSLCCKEVMVDITGGECDEFGNITFTKVKEDILVFEGDSALAPCAINGNTYGDCP